MSTQIARENLSDHIEQELGDAVEIRLAENHDAIDGVMPQTVAAPKHEDAARELVAWCGREKIALAVRGNRSELGNIGAPPRQLELVISTRHLTQVWDYDEGNATICAGAGISLTGLNNVVGEKQQFVPVEYSQDVTLGSVVATNYWGASKMRYGAPRDLVTGVDAVLSDGRLVRGGGKVVKNVSGYDLPKVFTGSFGSLGLFTRVTIRLRPQNAATQWWQLKTDWNTAEKIAFHILDGAFEPAVLRVASTQECALVFVRLEGVESSVQSQVSKLQNEFGGELHSDSPAGIGNEPFVLRSVLPLRLAAQWSRRLRELGATTLTWDAGSGLVCCSFHELPDVHALRSEAQKLGGWMVVDRAPAEHKTPSFVWGAPDPGNLMLMRRLKEKFDPAGIFSPGRFVGGL